ncbi:MAG TPA: hypothetical protein VLC28_07100, partial [Flavitalea sp.]|nr:hypothetical protein [Flavitalea sp.]
MDSTQMAQTAAGLQQNISSLEDKNKTMQAQWDSSKAVAQAEAQRWTGLQGYYDEQKANVTNIHQQLHTALAETEGISADEITASNGRVYVTLDDQVFSGGQLSSKGRKAIADFAGVLKDKQDLVVDVASANSYAAYWNNGSAASSSTMGSTDASGNANASTDANSSANANSNSTASSSTSSDNATAATANTSTSSRPTARTSTTTHKSTSTVRRSSTATRSSRATASKSTARKSESGRKMSFKSGSSKTNNAWNTNIAKATAIAKELHKNGIYNVGLLVPGSANSTDAGVTTGKTNFQLIVSPKGDRYYQMIESNSPKNGTPGTGTSTGTGTTGGQQ